MCTCVPEKLAIIYICQFTWKGIIFQRCQNNTVPKLFAIKYLLANISNISIQFDDFKIQ